MGNIKLPPVAEIKVSAHRVHEIIDLAKQIFAGYTEESKRIGIMIPSARVAIDYLLVAGAQEGSFKVPMQSHDNNLWLAIIGERENHDEMMKKANKVLKEA